MTALGVDIGGSSIKVAVAADGAEPVTAASEAYADPDPTVLALAIGQALERAGRPDPQRVCVCLPGRVAGGTGVLEASANLPALVGSSIGVLVRDVIGCRAVTIETDVRAAAHHVWRARGVAGRLMAISIGTGVGACVLDDGVALRVSGSSSGHFGQIDVSLGVDAPIGPDGSRGSLEAYVGVGGLKRAGVNLHLSEIALRPGSDVLEALARAIRIAHAIYRPQHVFLLGGVGIRLGPSIEILRERIDLQLTSMAREGWTLETGWTAYHGALGAAMLASEALVRSS